MGSKPAVDAPAKAIAGNAIAQLRADIDARIASGDSVGAHRMLRELWVADSSASTASFLTSRYDQIKSKLGLLPYRVTILRSFTVEPMVPLLRAAAFHAGLDLSVQLSEFNAHVQEILDSSSDLYVTKPDVVFLCVQTRDVAPALWNDFSSLSVEQVNGLVSQVVRDFRTWIHSFRQNSQAHLVIHNLEQPMIPSRGILDSQSEPSQSSAIRKINSELLTLAAANKGVYLLDYDALVARYGRATWRDERKWATVRLPMAAQHLNHLVQEWLRFLYPLSGRIAKAVAVDLDNTLWGGVIGEDGMSGIRMGTDYPGSVFQDVQRALLDLYRRGILLAICSKNNYDDAMEALQDHPGMLLKPSHFAAVRINWNDKSQNLREIAAELNIGIDALALLDDNPVERQQVREQVPEMFVIEVPSDPLGIPRAVRNHPALERLSLSDEDAKRGEYYQAQREREHLEQSYVSREDFYRSLEQVAEITPLDSFSLSRIAQLTNKTNQFNLTTRRYTEQQLAELVANPGWYCSSLRVRDRFGDNGIVGVAILHHSGKACEIDTLLLSCRVIGRGIETAFLSFLAAQARKMGAEALAGWFLPTKKNAPARDFYRDHGFRLSQEKEQGTQWQLDISRSLPPCPEWVRLSANKDNGR